MSGKKVFPCETMEAKKIADENFNAIQNLLTGTKIVGFKIWDQISYDGIAQNMNFF